MNILSLEISPILSENIKFIIFLVLIILGVCHFYSRTSSMFSIFYRLVTLFLGKPRSNADLINDIIEIERFNFLYNKNAVSLQQKEKFEKWIRNYELDFKLITSIGRGLDIDKLKINKINKKSYIFSYAFSLLWLLAVLFLSVISSLILVKNSALLSFNDSGKFFWMNSYEAKGFPVFDSNNIWKVDLGVCKEKTSITNLSIEEFDTICNSLSSEDGIKYINDLISKQNVFFRVFLIVSIFPIFYFYQEIRKLINNNNCRRMIYRKIKKKRSNK